MFGCNNIKLDSILMVVNKKKDNLGKKKLRSTVVLVDPDLCHPTELYPRPTFFFQCSEMTSQPELSLIGG